MLNTSTANTSSPYLGYDPSNMGNLRLAAKQDPHATLKAAAKQFEALMVNQMLKSMRESHAEDSVDDPYSSQDTQTYQGLLDEQWSQQLTRGRGIGLADMITRQLDKTQTPNKSNALKASLSSIPPVATTSSSVAANEAPARQNLPDATAQIAGLDSHRAAFVQSVWPDASRVGQQLGIAPELVVAHAALESGWGKRPIGQNGQGHNLFGIKAGSSWSGAVANVQTTEFIGGVPQKQTAAFRDYANQAHAFDDYAHLLSSHYHQALNSGSDAKSFAKALQSGGYATDPNYSRKLEQVASQLLNRA